MKLSNVDKQYLVNKSPVLWLEHHNIVNEQGVPMDFHNHLFQYEIYEDMSPKQVIYKPAQVGFSTAAIFKTLFIAKNRGMDIIYTLPTANDVKDFVGGKVNRLIAQNAILKQWVKDKDSVEQKSVGDNLIYYRGTWTQKAAMMVSSDLNVYDEVDSSKQDVIEQYSTRLQHSKHGWEWFFSHPSVPGNGVAKHWEKSDQKHWFIKCSRCSKKQYMEWPENIDFEMRCFICKHCKMPMREEDRRIGEWVKKYKDRDWSGYWINLMMCPWVSSAKILEDFETKSEEQFYNKVLGLPYVGSGNVVLEQDILDNLTSDILQPTDEKRERIVIGVDTGVNIWYVVGGEKGIFYWNTAKDYTEIEQLMKRYPSAVAVFDQGGDLILPRLLREKYPGRIFLCHYSVDRKTQEFIRWGKNDEEGNVVADRNRMIQLVVDEFKQKRIRLQGSQADWWDYWLHWKNIYRQEQENALGVPVKKWMRSGDDHLVHATVYWRIGMDRFGLGQGAILLPEDELTVDSGVTLLPGGTIEGDILRGKFN